VGEVALLLKADGTVASVWADRGAAEAQAAAYNADAQGDPDAPYRVETWRVG
jgi:hypothetical protein